MALLDEFRAAQAEEVRSVSELMLRTKPRSPNGMPAEEEEALSTGAMDGTSGDVAVSIPTKMRLNPRTGKPLSMPKPLSLSPHPMSPIVDEIDADPSGGQLVHEEHEEVKLVHDSTIID